MAKFEATELTCVRGQNLIFTDLVFDLEDGGALVLAGPNGSGKSSLIRVMAGLIRPFAGQLAWDGEDVFDDIQAHSDRLLYVGHANAIKAPLTVRENLTFWAELSECVDKVDEALGALDLMAIADNPGRILSSGQRRRLNLARLLVSDRPLWILDEPTVGLDVASCRDLENLIANHRQSGGMVILSTHVGIDVPDHKILDVGLFSETTFQREAS